MYCKWIVKGRMCVCVCVWEEWGWLVGIKLIFKDFFK